MKNLWKKLKLWFIKNWNILKKWLEKYWMIIVNYLIIFISYSIVFGHDEVVWAQFLLGIWMFTSIAYAMFKIFMKGKKISK